MTTVQRKLVHKQFNSPLGLYSDSNVKATLNRELKALSNGTMGIECDDSSKPANLANSAVLKLLEEEEHQKRYGQHPGYKRVAWPPEHEYAARASQSRQSVPRQSQPRQSPAFQPQAAQNYHVNPLSPQSQYQNNSGYRQSPHPQQYSQPQHAPQSYQQQHQPQYQQQQHQPQYQQQQHQPQYQQQQQHQPQYQQQQQQQQQQQSQYQQQQQSAQQYQHPSAQKFRNPDPTFLRQSTPSYLPPPSQQGRASSPGCTTAFSGGISVGGNKPPPRAQYSPAPNRGYGGESVPPPVQAYSVGSPQPQHQASNPLSPEVGSNVRGWSRVKPATPVYSGYTQPQLNQQQSYHNPQPSHEENRFQQQGQSQNVYQRRSHEQQSQTYPHQQSQYQQPQQQYHYEQQQQQQQYQTRQSQYQPQQHYQSQDNFYRQPSPGVVTLRSEPPLSQQSAPVYASQPAAQSYGGGTNLRGDQKWPPQEFKQSVVDNEARRRLALGPTCRPRRVNKDYTDFFNRYSTKTPLPGYRAPPGTQHYVPYPTY